MALPPEPIQELLPLATVIAMARVTRVVEQAEQAPLPERDSRIKGGSAGMLAEQLVSLEVTELLRGDGPEPGAELMAVKPPGAYTLVAGVSGPFLLQPHAEPQRYTILGRYGPDSYRRHVIEAAL